MPDSKRFASAVDHRGLRSQLLWLYRRSAAEWAKAWLKQRLIPLEYLDELVPRDGVVYEFGCGIGVISNYLSLSSSGRKVTGCDLDGRKISVARDTIGDRSNIRYLALDVFQVGNATVDVVVLSDFMHHIPLPMQEKLLELLNRFVRPRGIVIIKEVDNDHSMRFQFSRLSDQALYPGQETYYYSKEELAETLTHAGFKVVESSRRDGAWGTAVLLSAVNGGYTQDPSSGYLPPLSLPGSGQPSKTISGPSDGSSPARFAGRVGLQQRVIPPYRVPFFDALTRTCEGGLQIFAGLPRPAEGIRDAAPVLKEAGHIPARNVYFGGDSTLLFLQKGILNWLGRWRPDVLVVDCNVRCPTTFAAAMMMKLRGRPVIGWGLGTLAGSTSHPAQAFRARIRRSLYCIFDAIIAYSTKGARDYVDLGLGEERVFVARNAVSADAAEALSKEFARSPEVLARWRSRLSPHGRPIVLFVGRLLARKRVADLIRACVPLHDACELAIVGDGPERQALEGLAEDVLPGARFLGHRSGRDLALCFAGSDLFVLPGLGGLAVQEAMIYGKPVIVAQGDGTEYDLAKDGRNGYIVTPGDVDALSEAIRRCVEDPAKLECMGQASRKIIEEQVNLDAMVAAFVSVLNHVAKTGL